MKDHAKEQADIESLQHSIESYSPTDQSSHLKVVSSLQWLLTCLSHHSISLQEEMKKKQYALDKLKKMGGEDYQKSRYCFVIQLLIATKVELQECIDTGNELRHKLITMLASLQGKQTLVKESPVVLECLPNFCALHDIDILLKSSDSMKQNLAVFLQDQGSPYIKQRSSVWFSLRKKFHVTGSTVYAATGAGGLKAQREHFMQTVLGKDSPVFPPEVQAALDHGQKYESSAMATFCTSFLPSFFPNHAVYELGGVSLDASGIDMFVSPDGALYNTNTGMIEAVVEIKCPYTAELHMSIPSRYYLQVQAEMMALNVDTCYFVSFKMNMTRVFKIVKDEETWNLATRCLIETFANNNKRLPARLSDSSKMLTKKIKEAASTNCHLVAEMPSVLAAVNDVLANVNHVSPSMPFSSHVSPDPFISDLPNINVNWNIQEAVSVTETVYAHNSKVHQLLRKKATELMTLVASDTDRLWSKNQLTGTPICYFLKGYSLPMDVMRSILEDTLDRLFKLKIHVPCVAFDGQFMKLLREDKSGKPQTVLQVQKHFWQSVGKMSKAAIVSELKTVGMIDSLSDVLISSHDSDKSSPVVTSACAISVTRKNSTMLPKTSIKHLRVAPRTQESRVAAERTENLETLNTTDEELYQQAVADAEFVSRDTEVDCMEDLPDIPPVETPVSSRNAQSIDSTVHDQIVVDCLNDIQLDEVLCELAREHDKWKDKDLRDIKQSLLSCQELSKLKVSELKTVARYLKHQLNKNIAISGSRLDLLKAIKCCLGIVGEVERCPRRKTAPTLRMLALRCIQSQKYPKSALNVSYAQWKFPEILQTWRNMSNVRHGMSIPEVDPDRVLYWFYVPEFSESRHQLEVKRIDTHHLLTRHRSALCKGDLGKAKKEHFIQIATDNSTSLKPGMMEQELNMQSTDFARITFSENVEQKLEERGHEESAALCKNVREWFAANDEPGISAVERCRMKLRYRDYLLSLCDLSSFPPPGSHIRGYPLPLWEATLASIDADFHMYAISKRRTYNNRSLSSQPCESLYSCLATMPGAKNGVPSAVDLEVNMAKICGEFVVRQDPTRGFSTRLSSAPVYPQVLLEREVGPLHKPQAPPSFIDEIKVQDHLFDSSERRRLARRIPRGLSNLHEPGRGGKGVRQYHKVDESKLNPLIRAGRPLNSIQC